MRLTTNQREIIKTTINRELNVKAQVWLFGSRIDNNQHGGDIDLLIETPDSITLLQKAKLKQWLERQLSIPVDLIIIHRDKPLTPFQKIALAQGILF